MPSKTIVPVEEYLNMRFDGPDREYLDGEIIERRLGSKPHSKGQMRLLRFFDKLRDRHSLHIFPDLRVRISPQRYRVPDIAVYLGNEPADNVPALPPDVVVEILSEDDRYVEVLEKLAEYHLWGAKRVWLADPGTRKFFIYDHSGYHEAPAFELPELNATITAAEFFAD